VDADGDGFGDANASTAACNQPAGHVPVAGDDCPDVYELQVPRPYFIDADGDGYGGSTSSGFCLLSPPPGYTADSLDCDDADPAVFAAIRYFADQDGDGFGDPDTYVDVCLSAAPPGFVTNSDDLCPDDSVKSEPGACGCGQDETDSDDDGTPDCVDATPPLFLEPKSGSATGTLVIHVRVGPQLSPTVGAQLTLHYDTSKLAFVSMVPGQDAGVFSIEILEQVNAAAGTIRYAVGAPGGSAGSAEPARVATITFALADGVAAICGLEGLVRFAPVDGAESLLSGVLGEPIIPTLLDLDAVTVHGEAPSLAGVPRPWTRPADAGLAGSLFVQPEVTLEDACAPRDTTPVQLLVTAPDGSQSSQWPAGAIFGIGTTTVT
jgi:hypothetical protein